MSRKSEISISRLRAIEQVEEKTICDAGHCHRLSFYGAIFFSAIIFPSHGYEYYEVYPRLAIKFKCAETGHEGVVRRTRIHNSSLYQRHPRSMNPYTLPMSVEITFSIDPYLCDVAGDAAQIHQALMILRVNAR